MSIPTRDDVAVTHQTGLGAAPRPAEKVAAYLTAAWCLGFAVVSAWQLVPGGGSGSHLMGYESGLTVMIAGALVLKLLGP